MMQKNARYIFVSSVRLDLHSKLKKKLVKGDPVHKVKKMML